MLPPAELLEDHVLVYDSPAGRLIFALVEDVCLLSGRWGAQVQAGREEPSRVEEEGGR